MSARPDMQAMGQAVDPIGENVELDENLMTVFPAGTKVLRVTPHGVSDFLTTLRIDVQHADGTRAAYFKKGAGSSLGAAMVEGFWQTDVLMNSLLPHRVPRPIGRGQYKSDPSMSFFVSEFVPMSETPLQPKAFARALADLHLASMGKAPGGRFGFHVPTHTSWIPHLPLPLVATRETSWAEWFGSAMRRMFDEEAASRARAGREEHDAEWEKTKATIIDKLVPRLLGPLETHGRTVTVCLNHSDTWPGNMKLREGHSKEEEGEVVMFDGAAFWGHNEADLFCCRRPSRYFLTREHVDAYFELVPMAEPAEEAYDRVWLYSLRAEVLCSTIWPLKDDYRIIVQDETRELWAKYDDGHRD